MNTNMTKFMWCMENLCMTVLLTKVALALEGLKAKILPCSLPCVMSLLL